MKHTAATIVLAAATLAACSVTGPVAVITDRDGTLRGTATATMQAGSFSVANDKMQCAGTYNPHDSTPTIQVVFQCSDGRTGFAIVTRTGGGNGHGTVRMSDGTTGNLVMGAAAASL